MPRDGARGRPTFDEVYQEQFPYVWRTLRRLGVAEKDIEDLTHDVFVVVNRKLTDYDAARPIKPWLFGIAFRLASAERRRGRPIIEEAQGDEGDPIDEAPSAVELLEADEQRQLVLDCLKKLDPDQRAAVILVDVDGENPTEVANALGIPLPTVYSRLRLGRARFAAGVRRAKLRRGET